MCESTWVHERPASASFRDLTVVTQKSASPALKKKNNLSLNEDKRNTANNELAFNAVNEPTVQFISIILYHS